MSRPSVASNSLRCTILDLYSGCSSCRNFASLVCDKCKVSNAKEKLQPHQRTSVLSCAFFQDIGALMHARKASKRQAGHAQ